MDRFGGIDLGGTKIEARLFDESFKELNRRRIDTPSENYEAMCAAILEQARWLDDAAPDCVIGLGAPGLINPRTKEMLTANLPATGQKLPLDLEREFGRPIPCINDCRAFSLSEAVMGEGRGHSCVLGLILGTGVAGGLVINGRLQPDLNNQQGEYGHLPIPAMSNARHGLPILPCGCGKEGCFETMISGPGLTHLAQLKTGRIADTRQIMGNFAFVDVMAIWTDLVAELLSLLIRVIDPQVIVLGGGLGMHGGLCAELFSSIRPKLLANTMPPAIAQAQGGDASGARGAALYARSMREAGHV